MPGSWNSQGSDLSAEHRTLVGQEGWAGAEEQTGRYPPCFLTDDRQCCGEGFWGESPGLVLRRLVQGRLWPWLAVPR